MSEKNPFYKGIKISNDPEDSTLVKLNILAARNRVSTVQYIQDLLDEHVKQFDFSELKK